ncbi:phosphatidylinositol mannoside acyltransferase [Cellulomonas sp. P24]|uniref:phosphatidylinositol mannoside acyltransferase n=1 Tax=Cellulomonas sp. P24 TaxID=2885206 RepID=UPI00216AF0E5|nr:phosphatidylinositol mannoside acyltransferase [Cellulomonas sp. P24]MCR6494561.1 phosphatidylinositol mannoside acyltransferase [Cellulomonas sp. P24]
MSGGSSLTLAWRIGAHVPGGVVRAAGALVADAAWVRRGKGVRQLERNLRRLRPDVSRRELRALSRAGMRSYMRYYGEAFTLSTLTEAQIAARVRTVGEEHVRLVLARGERIVVALGHQGNWDLAGAWATANLAPVTTVAERLEPEELFQEFLAFREGLGMTILPLTGGPDVFRELLRVVGGGSGAGLVPLVADRDLTHRGIEVDLLGHLARVAAGPAALAVSTGAPLFAASIWYERLTGERRRRAGSPWGIVVEFLPVATASDGVPRAERVAVTTQAWVDAIATGIAAHPADWHMLQKVFVADLDPARDAEVAATAETRGGTA